MPAAKTVEALNPSSTNRGDDNVDKRRRQHPLPTEIHQLIVTEARQGPTQPKIQIKEQTSLRQKHDQANDNVEVVIARRFKPAHPWKIPAAEIEGRGNCCDDDHRRILSHKEKRQTNA